MQSTHSGNLQGLVLSLTQELCTQIVLMACQEWCAQLGDLLPAVSRTAHQGSLQSWRQQCHLVSYYWNGKWENGSTDNTDSQDIMMINSMGSELCYCLSSVTITMHVSLHYVNRTNEKSASCPLQLQQSLESGQSTWFTAYRTPGHFGASVILADLTIW